MRASAPVTTAPVFTVHCPGGPSAVCISAIARLLSSASTITASAEAGQAATTLIWKNIVKMWARLHPRFSESAIWLASPTCKPSLESMTIDVGTAGSVIKAINENEGRSTLLGRPIRYTEHCSALGTLGDIVLVAPSEYFVGMRQQVLIEMSRHVAFVSDETGFRSIMRVDGQPKWASAYTPRQGDSLSWCVVLAAR